MARRRYNAPRPDQPSDSAMSLSGLVLIAGGIYGLLAAFRVVPVSKDSGANEQWLQRFGLLMKIVCPLLILFGLAELFQLLG